MAATVLEQNIKLLASKFSNDKLNIDYNFEGYIPGESFVLTAQNALMNDLKMWFYSQRGDYYGRLEFGGFFDSVSSRYPLQDATVPKLEDDLKAALANQMPKLDIKYVKAIPDIPARTWRIIISAFDLTTGILADVEANIETNTTR